MRMGACNKMSKSQGRWKKMARRFKKYDKHNKEGRHGKLRDDDGKVIVSKIIIEVNMF